MKFFKYFLCLLLTLSCLHTEVYAKEPELTFYGFNSIDYKPSKRDETNPSYTNPSKENLPSYYSSVDKGYVTPVKDQGNYGICWSFGTMAAAETYMKKNVSNKNYDLSERHLAYFLYNSVDDPLKNTTGDRTYLTSGKSDSYLQDGGNGYLASLFLSQFCGPVNESVAPLTLYSTMPNLNSNLAYGNNTFVLKKAIYLEGSSRNEIKSAIYKSGAATCSYYASNNYWGYNSKGQKEAYMSSKYPAGNNSNHLVTIVGWDDNYSKYNFNASARPDNNGAWLIKNSWGTNTLADGYFWISYEEPTICEFIAYEYADASSYDHNYHYDGTTSVSTVTLTSGSKISNIYQVKGNTSGGSEQLKAVSFAIDSTDINYSIQVYKNVTNTAKPDSGTPALKKPVTGKTTYSGIYTIDLSDYVELTQGEYFSIVITLTNPTGSSIRMLVDASANYGWVAMTNNTKANRSFYNTGSSWRDAYNQSFEFRIKALTSDVDNNDFSYTVVNGNEAKITSYLGSDKVVTIPQSIDGKTVTALSKLFLSNKKVEEIKIPSSVKSIEVGAFTNCVTLKKITVDSSNATYSSQGGALYNKSKSILICVPEGLKDITIPSTTTTIRQSAFFNSSMGSVTIPKTVTSIDKNAFPSYMILCVYQNSYAHNYAMSNGLQYKFIKPMTFIGVKQEISLQVGESMTLKINVLPADTTDNKVFTYSSSDSSVVSVDSNGKITAKKVGTATITIKSANGLKTQSKITVTKGFGFDDVKPGKWYYDVVKQAFEAGLMSGTSDTEFSPNANMTRGMLVTVMHRIAGKPSVSFKGKFSDVPKSSYCATAVEWAANNKVVSGYSDGRFRPNYNITRQDVAVILHNYAKSLGLDETKTSLNKFADKSSVSSYARPALEWAVSVGILSGSTDASGKVYLNPRKNATRAECAKMLLVASEIFKK